MANKIFNIRVKNKRDTEANWKKKNPVLLDGEIIIVTTTSGDTRFKVGDGKKTYNQLPFQDQKTRDLIPSVDSSLSSTSTNPVQNKIIKSELDKKAERDVVNTTTNGLMSVADKKKLDGIADGANKTTVDSALSSTSTNPVQNKVVNAALINKLNKNADLTTDYKILTEKDVWAKAGVYAGDGSFNNTICLKCSGAGSGKVVTDANALSRLSVGAPVSTDDATTKNYVDTGLSGKLDKSGGTLTGNLSGKYITGTWLQTTEATDLGRTPGKIPVLDESGWVYYRTLAELKSDISADYVIDQGTTGAWTWRKWHSGIAEMWGIFEATSLAVNNAWGSVYYGTWMSSTVNKNGRKYPFAFADAPVVTATPYSQSTDFWLLTDSANNVGTALTHAPAYACVLPRSATITGPQIHYHVIGKYK